MFKQRFKMFKQRFKMFKQRFKMFKERFKTFKNILLYVNKSLNLKVHLDYNSDYITINTYTYRILCCQAFTSLL